MNGGQPSTYESVAKRSGVAPSGVHATSGNWIIVKQSGSGSELLTTYKTSGDEITMSDPTGAGYTAKLNGSDYPVHGAYGYDAVSLKKINAHTFEETDKRDGTVTDVSTMTISANGKTMTVVDTDSSAAAWTPSPQPSSNSNSCTFSSLPGSRVRRRFRGGPVPAPLVLVVTE